MTGAYLFTIRNEKRVPVEVEHLTDEERDARFRTEDPENILAFFNLVCKTLAEIDSDKTVLIPKSIEQAYAMITTAKNYLEKNKE
jgi:hypothetical protein